MVTKSLEEYLKTMYILKKQNGNIRVTDIANKMSCSKASVNKALNNLKQNNLIKYETYGPIELTTSGIDLAKKILEAYDIVYIFFKDVLNLDEDNAKSEAENIKSMLDDDSELVTLIYGQDATEEQAEEIAAYVEEISDAEVEIESGQQPVYSFIIGVE